MRSRAAKQAAWTRFTEACAVVEAAEKAAAEAIAAIHWGHLISATQMEALTRAAAKAAADSAKKTETLTSLRTLASKVVKAADVKAANSLPNLRTLASKILKAAAHGKAVE